MNKCLEDQRTARCRTRPCLADTKTHQVRVDISYIYMFCFPRASVATSWSEEGLLLKATLGIAAAATSCMQPCPVQSHQAGLSRKEDAPHIRGAEGEGFLVTGLRKGGLKGAASRGSHLWGSVMLRQPPGSDDRSEDRSHASLEGLCQSLLDAACLCTNCPAPSLASSRDLDVLPKNQQSTSKAYMGVLQNVISQCASLDDDPNPTADMWQAEHISATGTGPLNLCRRLLVQAGQTLRMLNWVQNGCQVSSALVKQSQATMPGRG